MCQYQTGAVLNKPFIDLRNHSLGRIDGQSWIWANVYLSNYCFLTVYWGNDLAKRLSANPPRPTITLAVSSTEFCQSLLDERDIRKGLGGGCGHVVMIPLL